MEFLERTTVYYIAVSDEIMREWTAGEALGSPNPFYPYSFIPPAKVYGILYNS